MPAIKADSLQNQRAIILCFRKQGSAGVVRLQQRLLFYLLPCRLHQIYLPKQQVSFSDSDYNRYMEKTHDFENLILRPIARVRTPYKDGFGIPRQGSLLKDSEGVIQFEPRFRNPGYIRGLEQYSHLWLIWGFSDHPLPYYRATVRPPHLGGNEKVGVFASRSPHRPNPIGMTCVRLLSITYENGIPMIRIGGVDMMDGSPVYDLKPYIPYSDCFPDSLSGYADSRRSLLHVTVSEEQMKRIPKEKQACLMELLELDPRPSYQKDGKEYGMRYDGFEIRFSVKEDQLFIKEILASKSE